MTVADYEKALGCLLAWREERSNGVNGMLGVLFVVRNRSKANWGQGDWSKIIESHNQFSSVSVLDNPETVLYPDVRNPQFLDVLQTVDAIYNDERQDLLTMGALYYADMGSPLYDKDGWFAKNIAGDPDQHPRVAQIGTTTYFK
jgi:Cell Wall Hydrolase